ncbi:MAG: hypothetical protein J6K72_04870 [Clostridia bacterium]|nr:hypothetical protein [Clostridia bacterium]
MKTVTPEACKKIFLQKPITKSLYNGFVANGWEAHLPAVYDRADSLFVDNASASPALQMHLNQLLPIIALYEKAVEITGSVEGALAFTENGHSSKRKR